MMTDIEHRVDGQLAQGTITVPVYRAGVPVDGIISEQSAEVFLRVFAAYRSMSPSGVASLRRRIDARRRAHRRRARWGGRLARRVLGVAVS